MDSAVAGLLGAFIGSLGSIVSPIAVEYWKSRRAGRLDKIRRQHLIKLLTDPRWESRSFEALSDSIGADDEKTIELLLEVGARRLRSRDRNQWALASRVPHSVDQAGNAAAPN